MSLVIFDCDGVLFDSWHANVAYYNAVLERLGLAPMTAEWERRAHFMAAPQFYDALFGAGHPLASQARQVGVEVDYDPFYRLMVPARELDEVLAALKGRYRLAMATNRGGTVRGVVREFGLDRFLDLAVGIRDVARPKPHPDLIEKCLQHFGVAAGMAVYVGDAETDRQAAEAAGVRFVAVGDHCAADVRVRELRELPAVLPRLPAAQT